MINSYATVDFLKKALNGSMERHEAISNNIANVNTPGYKKITVEFENMLNAELDEKYVQLNRTEKNHIDNQNELGDNYISITRDEGYSTRRDENNVNIDLENAKLAKNTIIYNALIKQLSNEFNRMKIVISEGGK